MKTAFNRLEKFIIILSILSTSFLLIIQFLNYDDNYTIYTSGLNSKNKFIPFSSTEKPEKGIVILKNMDPTCNEIEVLLNGNSIANFTDKDEIKISVYENDIIEIDGTKYNKNLNIKVVGISNNIKNPKLDTIITTSQSIEILGKVQLK